MVNAKVEIGSQEKHTLEFTYNNFTSMLEVLIDGKSVHKGLFFFHFNKTFQVGENEKHEVNVVYGIKEVFAQKPTIKIDERLCDSTAGDSKNQGILKNIFSIVGVAVGAFFGIYAGLNFLIPFFAWLIFVLLIFKLGKLKDAKEIKKLEGTIFALQLGYASWMLFGFLYVGDSSILFDIGVLIVLGLLFYLKPGKLSSILLILYSLFGFFINLVQTLSFPLGSIEHRGVVTHLFLRVVTFVLLGLWLIQSKKDKKEVAPT